jgi:hypothetical protein
MCAAVMHEKQHSVLPLLDSQVQRAKAGAVKLQGRNRSKPKEGAVHRPVSPLYTRACRICAHMCSSTHNAGPGRLGVG